MYRTIIELKEETPKEIAKEIRQICINAHDNFVGKVQIKDQTEPRTVLQTAVHSISLSLLRTDVLK